MPEPQWGCIHRPDPDRVAQPSKHDSTGSARWAQNPSRSACTGAVPGGVGCQGGHGPWSRVPVFCWQCPSRWAARRTLTPEASTHMQPTQEDPYLTLDWEASGRILVSSPPTSGDRGAGAAHTRMTPAGARR